MGAFIYYDHELRLAVDDDDQRRVTRRHIFFQRGIDLIGPDLQKRMQVLENVDVSQDCEAVWDERRYILALLLVEGWAEEDIFTDEQGTDMKDNILQQTNCRKLRGDRLRMITELSEAGVCNDAERQNNEKKISHLYGKLAMIDKKIRSLERSQKNRKFSPVALKQRAEELRKTLVTVTMTDLSEEDEDRAGDLLLSHRGLSYNSIDHEPMFKRMFFLRP